MKSVYNYLIKVPLMSFYFLDLGYQVWSTIDNNDMKVCRSVGTYDTLFFFSFFLLQQNRLQFIVRKTFWVLVSTDLSKFYIFLLL